MFSSLRIAYRYWRIKPSDKLMQWREKGGMIQFIVYNEILGLPVIFMIGDTKTFADIQNTRYFEDFRFNLPKDIDPKRTIYNILLEETKPVSIEVQHANTIFSLKNQARQAQTGIYIRNFQNPQGLIKLFKLNELDIGQTKRILTNFYLKLQTQAYCKLNNHTNKTQLTQTLKQQIFNYLNYCNEINSQQNILYLHYQRQRALEMLTKVREDIDKILHRADRIVRIYKIGLIGVTSFHLVSFGYMIFWVQWLGWDIIQPLTYTASMISVLLGIRYYRKFSKDRNYQNIRDRLRSFVLNKQYRLEWLRLKEKEKQDQKLLRLIQQKIKIEKNRLAPISTISTLL